MKYYVTTDKRGYVLTVQHTGTFKDYVELDISKYDISKKRAYKLGKNELIFDSEEWERITAEKKKKEDEQEIATLKEYLNETDYITARVFEEIMSLNNPLTFIADVIKITTKYTALYHDALENRVEARNRIQELEDKE